MLKILWVYRGKQIRFFEIALGVFLAGKPMGKRIGQVKKRPIMVVLLGRYFEFIDF